VPPVRVFKTLSGRPRSHVLHLRRKELVLLDWPDLPRSEHSQQINLPTTPTQMFFKGERY
jgi:hypothetical protein